MTNKQIVGLLTVVVKILVALGVVGACIYYILYVSIPDKVRGEVGTQLATPLQTLGGVGEKANRIDRIESKQDDMSRKLTELTVKFDLYFEKRLDRASAENTSTRAGDLVKNTQDPVQRTVALQVLTNVLDMTTANHVVMDYKKVNQTALTLLDQNYEEDQKPILKRVLSGMGQQRTLKIPSPEIPTEEKQEPKYIIGKEQTLDAVPFRDVTFVNCRACPELCVSSRH